MKKKQLIVILLLLSGDQSGNIFENPILIMPTWWPFMFKETSTKAPFKILY